MRITKREYDPGRLHLSEHWDILIIGGGFFGLYLADHLAKQYDRILLCERESDLMQRASYNNQARVHQGYHYPRSILTAYRSRVNFPRFVEEFRPCIDSSFEKYYAIARRFSKVTADQFHRFIQQIGAPITPAPREVRRLFDPGYIEEVFLVREYAFNAVILKELILERVRRAGVHLGMRTEVLRLRQTRGDAIEVELAREDGPAVVVADQVFCCTYAQINATLERSGLERIPLKHELVEQPLVEVPAELEHRGVTVMCGPFFSCMPFPPVGIHTIHHVRYTPQAHWYDSGPNYMPAYERFARAEKRSAYPHIIRDASRYLPAMAGCRYIDSLWEVKTLLPLSELDDSRPILFRPHYGLRNHHVVMGGKIDNVYDLVDAVQELMLATSGDLHV
jgi:glycine/D-amino acid oxidase-like deaminating enzyme